MNSFAKYIINRKTVHKKYYRCNICIDTHTHCSQSTGINVSGDKSICMAKSSHSDHLQLPLTPVEDTGTLKTRVKTEMLLCLDEFLCFRSSKLHLKLFSLITHKITMSVILIFIALCYCNAVINKVICQHSVQNPTMVYLSLTNTQHLLNAWFCREQPTGMTSVNRMGWRALCTTPGSPLHITPAKGL